MYCRKTNVPLEVEHIVPKSRGGSSRVSNLAIACHKCNQKKGSKTAEEFGFASVQKRASQSLRAVPFMNVVRSHLFKQLQASSIPVSSTFGFVTKHDRIKQGIEKSHVNDAFVIAGGISQHRTIPYSLKQVRRNNRCLQLNRKGHKPFIRMKRYKLQPNDLIRYNGEEHRVKGSSSYGKSVRLSDGTNANVKNVELITYGKGVCYV